MTRVISQRELRNDSGAVLREVQAGRTIIVTRNGVPVAELGPSRRGGSFLVRSSPTPPSARRAWTPPACEPTWTGSWTSPSMAEPARGLLDTSVVVDHDVIDLEQLPDESAIAAVTLAELAAAPHATDDEDERARRQDRLQWAAATWDALSFDVDAARAFGRVFAATRATGRSGGARLADLLIASTAAANALTLYTRNAADFRHLEGVVTVVGV